MTLPSVLRIAEEASEWGQRSFVRVFGAQLACAVIVPVLFLWPAGSVEGQRIQGAVAATVFASNVVLTTLNRSRSFEKIWYQGRAVAESLKSMAWKYAMRAEPYRGDGADGAFVKDVHKQVSQTKLLSVGTTPLGEFITSEMRQIRGMSIAERRDIYMNQRIEDQCSWYTRKARYWRTLETRLFWVVIGLQVLGVALMIARLVWSDIPTSLASMVAALGTAAVAWGGMRRTGEVSEAFGQAAFDIAQERERGFSIEGDQDLASWVSDTENAISREHTSWLARREVR